MPSTRQLAMIRWHFKMKVKSVRFIWASNFQAKIR